jgi:hypothetical protein
VASLRYRKPAWFAPCKSKPILLRDGRVLPALGSWLRLETLVADGELIIVSTDESDTELTYYDVYRDGSGELTVFYTADGDWGIEDEWANAGIYWGPLHQRTHRDVLAPKEGETPRPRMRRAPDTSPKRLTSSNRIGEPIVCSAIPRVDHDRSRRRRGRPVNGARLAERCTDSIDLAQRDGNPLAVHEQNYIVDRQLGDREWRAVW